MDGPSGPSRQKWTIGALASACVALCCAHEVAGVVPAAPQHPDRVALAPLNFNSMVPADLQAGAPYLFEEIERYLEARGCRLERLVHETVRDVWREDAGLGRVGNGGGRRFERAYDEALSALVAGLQERGKRFDALVLPYLMIRAGQLRGKAVIFDGVRRKLRVDFANDDLEQATFPTGETRVASLRVVVVDAQGVKQLDRYGGLEVLDYVRIEGRRPWWHRRSDLFENTDALREGIDVVFGPYFGT